MVFAGPKRFEKFLELSDESGKSKRALFSIPFYLYENIAMSVTGYVLARRPGIRYGHYSR